MMTFNAIRQLASGWLVSFQPLKSLPVAPVRTATRQRVPRASALGDWLTQTVAYHH